MFAGGSGQPPPEIGAPAEADTKASANCWINQAPSASGNLNSTNREERKGPAIKPIRSQMTMDAATPHHGVHLASPALQVDAERKSRLRRKPELNCGNSEKKTPAERTAGAACDVVDTTSVIASSSLYSTFPTQQKALARKQPETRAKLIAHLSRGASTAWPPSPAGTTAGNAWLPARFYKVHPNLLVEVARG